METNDKIGPDYPAAHSMDTDWFAVDAEGGVGFFSSGEPGPVPVSVEVQGDGDGLLRQIFLTRPDLLLVNTGDGDGDGDGAADAARHFLDDEVAAEVNWGQVGMLVRSADALRGVSAKFEWGNPLVTNAGTYVPVCFNLEDNWEGAVDRKTFAELHRAGVCHGCINLFYGGGRTDRIGVYYYDAGDNYQNGPYARGPVPLRPLRLIDLPPDLRAKLGHVRFDRVRFDQTAHLQPLEHMQCQTWGGDTYLASDLKTERPVPPPSE
jgi:hypothetical protein